MWMAITSINTIISFLGSMMLIIPYFYEIDAISKIPPELVYGLMVLILLGAVYGAFIIPFIVKNIQPFLTGMTRIIGSLIYLFPGYFAFLGNKLALTAGLLILLGSIGALSGIFRGTKAKTKPFNL